MIKTYEDSGFQVYKILNFKGLKAQKLSRKVRVSSQITANNDDAVNLTTGTKT